MMPQAAAVGAAPNRRLYESLRNFAQAGGTITGAGLSIWVGEACLRLRFREPE